MNDEKLARVIARSGDVILRRRRRQFWRDGIRGDTVTRSAIYGIRDTRFREACDFDYREGDRMAIICRILRVDLYGENRYVRTYKGSRRIILRVRS